MDKKELYSFIREIIHESITESELPVEVVNHISKYVTELIEYYPDYASNPITEEFKGNPNKFIISAPNTKLTNIPSFNIISGWSCPGASSCLAKIKQVGDKREIVRGKDAILRCFAAQLESRLPGLYENVLHNFQLAQRLSNSKDIAIGLLRAIHESGQVSDRFRIHVHGDFFNKEYFRAWLLVAKKLSHINFYAYTKSLHLLPKNHAELPDNLNITLSMGGKFDHLADDMVGYKKAFIVNSKEEADDKDLEIDYDDSLANNRDVDFALLIHGSQISGTDQAKLVSLYNTLTSLLRRVGVSDKDIKKIRAKMTVSEIVQTFFPELSKVLYGRIHRSNLTKYFKNIPSRSQIKSMPDPKDSKDLEKMNPEDIDKLKTKYFSDGVNKSDHFDEDGLRAELEKML